MSNTNYIKHLSEAYLKISEDNNLNPSHVSLYMALFQFWNQNRFRNPFFINRTDVMNLSKIGSKSTYHKCIRDLDRWNYIVYYPSHNPLRGSQIKLFDFGTTQRPLDKKERPTIRQVHGLDPVSVINIDKQEETIKEEKPRSKKEVLLFFCLLYTSPSPRDAHESRMPSSA